MIALMSVALIYHIGGFDTAIASAHPASTYSCGHGGTGGPSHCYAYMDWVGGVGGSFTDISVQHLYCPSSCAPNLDFVDDEMWLMQYLNPPTAEYWVETGYISESNGSRNVNYFWTDQRPGGGFHYHDFGQVPASDYYTDSSFEIIQNSPGEAIWDVTITDHDSVQ